ncbi:MAG: AAA family ATPase [Hydrogenophaga sp.]|nr:AAA family ATPase [Hydrogenophaga sp.]MDP1892529.1 AAA family ATPase [Hydrogenophaga sp.]
MYAGYFGLKQAPFSIAPDPHYLYMSERHREALAHLLYGIEGGGGFVLLSGEIGAGKTTICRCFLEQLPQHCNVAYIFNPKLTVGDLLKTICHEFQVAVEHEGQGPATIKEHLDPLNDYLLRSHAAGQHNILIIDEAQNLSTHVLEQLRLLTNLETSERKLLQIILIGQPELRQMLAQPELEQLAQRVIARFHLGALNEAETRQYVQHRLGVAGLQGPLPFSDEALRRVHAIARGVPRRINLLCDRALLGAYATGQARVERAVVDQAATEVFESEALAPSPTAAAGKALRQRLGTLALGAVGGAASAAALFALWTGGSLAPAPAAPEPTPATLPSATPAAVPAPTPPAAAATEPAPEQPTAATAPVPPEPTLGLPPLDALWRNEAPALSQLGSLWGTTLSGTEPCESAQRQQLQCFRIGRMTLHGLRQMDRPAVLLLRWPGQGTGWALLSAITSETATLDTANGRWRMPLTALADIWRGDYATLWRTPPGQQGRLNNGNSGPAANWLAQQLQQLQSSGQIAADASDFSSRIRAFQRSQGIDGDGLAGPMTFMLINRASGVDEPRLGQN